MCSHRDRQFPEKKLMCRKKPTNTSVLTLCVCSMSVCVCVCVHAICLFGGQGLTVSKAGFEFAIFPLKATLTGVYHHHAQPREAAWSPCYTKFQQGRIHLCQGKRDSSCKTFSALKCLKYTFPIASSKQRNAVTARWTLIAVSIVTGDVDTAQLSMPEKTWRRSF